MKNLEVNLTYSFIEMKKPVYGTPKHNPSMSPGKYCAGFLEPGTDEWKACAMSN